MERLDIDLIRRTMQNASKGILDNHMNRLLLMLPAVLDVCEAYYDTGLTPVEVAEIAQPGLIAGLDKLAEYESSGLQPDECRALGDAKAEGRLVVLPCKIGDTVYSIYFDHHAWEIQRIDLHADTTVFRCGNKGTDNYSAFHLSDLGKTVFLTRAEAQAALEAQGGT